MLVCTLFFHRLVPNLVQMEIHFCNMLSDPTWNTLEPSRFTTFECDSTVSKKFGTEVSYGTSMVGIIHIRCPCMDHPSMVVVFQCSSRFQYPTVWGTFLGDDSTSVDNVRRCGGVRWYHTIRIGSMVRSFVAQKAASMVFLATFMSVL